MILAATALVYVSTWYVAGVKWGKSSPAHGSGQPRVSAERFSAEVLSPEATWAPRLQTRCCGDVLSHLTLRYETCQTPDKEWHVALETRGQRDPVLPQAEPPDRGRSHGVRGTT